MTHAEFKIWLQGFVTATQAPAVDHPLIIERKLKEIKPDLPASNTKGWTDHGINIPYTPQQPNAIPYIGTPPNWTTTVWCNGSPEKPNGH